VLKESQKLPKLVSTSFEDSTECQLKFLRSLRKLVMLDRITERRYFKFVSSLLKAAGGGDAYKVYKVVTKIRYHCTSFKEGVEVFAEELINKGERVPCNLGSFTNKLKETIIVDSFKTIKYILIVG
jgi:hypothetical protein